MANNTYNRGKVHICREMCSTCIFRPGNLMQLNPGRVRQMVADATADPAGSITCHSTLEADQQAVCRGFYERHSTRALRLAAKMGVIEEIDPPSMLQPQGASK